MHGHVELAGTRLEAVAAALHADQRELPEVRARFEYEWPPLATAAQHLVRVVVAAEHNVDVRHLARQQLVVRRAHVRQRDDSVAAAAAQQRRQPPALGNKVDIPHIVRAERRERREPLALYEAHQAAAHAVPVYNVVPACQQSRPDKRIGQCMYHASG